ncbi:MAG: hypothetical protein ABI442_14410 [Gemmatimonadaceae bacterium]
MKNSMGLRRTMRYQQRSCRSPNCRSSAVNLGAWLTGARPNDVLQRYGRCDDHRNGDNCENRSSCCRKIAPIDGRHILALDVHLFAGPRVFAAADQPHSFHSDHILIAGGLNQTAFDLSDSRSHLAAHRNTPCVIEIERDITARLRRDAHGRFQRIATRREDTNNNQSRYLTKTSHAKAYQP